MWLKLLLGIMFVLSLVGAFVVNPARSQNGESNANGRDEDGRRLRLLSWNIGNGDLESETRAHDEDLAAVARVILDNEVDAVALQELTGADQLKLLLAHLNNRYHGYASRRGSADRVEVVLVKNRDGQGDPSGPGKRAGRSDDRVVFHDVPAGNRSAAAAVFRLAQDSPEILLVSAHADAFSAAARRTFAADVVDWTRSHTKTELAFVAGDFNFEVSTRNKNNLFTDDAKHDSETYAYLLKYFRDLGLDAGETSINDRRIDYVFGPAATISIRRTEVLRTAAVGHMDHWPLLIEVGF
jgi:endonuclease/exonuclease/phosphatase family metal-dependent hydrolase